MARVNKQVQKLIEILDRSKYIMEEFRDEYESYIEYKCQEYGKEMILYSGNSHYVIDSINIHISDIGELSFIFIDDCNFDAVLHLKDNDIQTINECSEDGEICFEIVDSTGTYYLELAF